MRNKTLELKIKWWKWLFMPFFGFKFYITFNNYTNETLLFSLGKVVKVNKK